MCCRLPVLLSYLFLVICFSKTTAQTTYNGYRVALFDVQILQQKSNGIKIRCRMANTGRQSLGTKNAATNLIVEFDSLGLPALLRGHESSIAEAVRGNCPKLKPAEISAPIWLNIRPKSREKEPINTAVGCAEMIFDTAYVADWSERTMRLHYFLKNTGTMAAHFFTKQAEPIINVYFVSGEKLTRGAIPAGSSSIQKGRETLDGLLLPGQILEGSVEISLNDRSKFSPNIALEFDPAQAINECGRTGNIWVIKLRY